MGVSITVTIDGDFAFEVSDDSTFDFDIAVE